MGPLTLRHVACLLACPVDMGLLRKGPQAEAEVSDRETSHVALEQRQQLYIVPTVYPVLSRGGWGTGERDSSKTVRPACWLYLTC